MDFNEQVLRAFQRLENFNQCDLPCQELNTRLLSELNTALHELQTAGAELYEQNEEMSANRQTLEEERRRYQELFEFAPDGYLVTDTEGVILEANHVATDLFRVSKAFLIGNPLIILVPNEERSTFLAHLAEIRDRIVNQNENWELVMLSGKRIAFPVSVTVGKVISTSGETLKLRWLLRDITKRKQQEAEMQKTDKLESLGILAGGIAHDLNNFLTIILGNLTLVKMLIDRDHRATTYLQSIEDAVGQTKNLTQQLLTFARGGQPQTKSVVINKLIEETAAFALSGSCARCEFLLAEDLPPVEVDQGQITQVITNLLINADQSMKDGGIIKIRNEKCVIDENCTLPLCSGEYVALTVTDEGAGISSEDLLKIFDPYFSTKKLGNGLGLTICYSIIKKHRGHIAVESREGKGTSFTVYLPISKKQAIKELPEYIFSLGSGQGKVLLMEDEESVRQTVYEMLTFLGYDVALAEDGAEAVSLYRDAFQSARPFDVVISDLTVRGGMGGIAAMSELIKINPDVKAIVSSGYSSDVLTDYINYGFCEVIAKPYKLQELGSVLARVVGSCKNDHDAVYSRS